MHERYDHVSVRIERHALGALRAHLVGPGREGVAAAGGVVIGAWLGVGSIGWYDDEATVLVGWPSAAGGTDTAGDVVAALGFGGVDDVAAERVTRLRATARPSSVAAIAAGGVFAQRWFEIDPGDWDEFLTLSTEAWPRFESSYDTTIEGLFRGIDDEGAVLLLTRYASFGEWERSRGTVTARDGDAAEAGRRFLRRREITRRSVVRVAPLLPPA